jgi:hypothetical protein
VNRPGGSTNPAGSPLAFGELIRSVEELEDFILASEPSRQTRGVLTEDALA